MMNNLYIPGCGDPCNTYYGGYRTRTFAEIFAEEENGAATYEYFASVLAETPFAAKLADVDMELLFYMLYARYGNSHIAFSDENQFIFALFSTAFQYGPTWSARLDIQKKLRALQEDGNLLELTEASTDIYNHSFNPSTSPSTQTLDELTTINDQNTRKRRLSKMDAYANLMALLDTDVSEEFLTKFRKLFIKVLAPDRPLLYETIIMEEN